MGVAVGSAVGVAVGSAVGVAVGSAGGVAVGFAVGSPVVCGAYGSQTQPMFWMSTSWVSMSLTTINTLNLPS